jgi:hypothetical protein
MSYTQENAIESLTHSLITRLLVFPITVLETTFEDNDRLVVIETVHRIFNLERSPGGAHSTARHRAPARANIIPFKTSQSRGRGREVGQGKVLDFHQITHLVIREIDEQHRGMYPLSVPSFEEGKGIPVD